MFRLVMLSFSNQHVALLTGVGSIAMDHAVFSSTGTVTVRALLVGRRGRLVLDVGMVVVLLDHAIEVFRGFDLFQEIDFPQDHIVEGIVSLMVHLPNPGFGNSVKDDVQ